MGSDKYIASLDVGTTTIRCFIFDTDLKIRGAATERVHLLNPQPGYFEIDPTDLWESIVVAITNAIREARLTAADITCLGISTQRCSFITWDKDTEEYFHNFITWKDLRADSLVKQWNSSIRLRLLNSAAYVLYLITRSKRFLAGALLKLMNGQITLRLLWQMKNNERLKSAIERKTALCGTLDSWLLYKLRKVRGSKEAVEHISDITSCTATGLYDPFTLGWAGWALNMFSINPEILPRVVESNYNFGYVHESIFGERIRITCSMSDQSCSLWGSNCFADGDIKMTLGTGSFMNVYTNKYCHASVHGLYPLVAWQFRRNGVNDTVFCIEGSVNDTGSMINWAINFGLFDDPARSSSIAESVPDSDGVYFIPAFSGLGPPINDMQAGTGFIGLRSSTRQPHLVRALLESIAFRIAQLFYCTSSETNYKFSRIKVDGGVSKNDFLCQTLADITGVRVERSKFSESSALGAAFVAGLNANIWPSQTHLEKFYSIDKVFLPREEMKCKYMQLIGEWEQAVERFKKWYVGAK